VESQLRRITYAEKANTVFSWFEEKGTCTIVYIENQNKGITKV